MKQSTAERLILDAGKAAKAWEEKVKYYKEEKMQYYWEMIAWMDKFTALKNRVFLFALAGVIVGVAGVLLVSNAF